MPHERTYYKNYAYWKSKAEELEFSSVDDAIKWLYHTHQSLHAVGRLFGVSSMTIRKHVHRLGVRVRPKGGANNLRGGPGKAEYQIEKMSLKAYCKKHGLNYNRVWNRISVLGWTVARAISTPCMR